MCGFPEHKPNIHASGACGAWLKNSACLLQGDRVLWSPVHGDLGEAANCLALEASVEQLLAHAFT